MHQLTVFTLLSVALTAACMSEASWHHRDRAGVPISTWRYRAALAERECRDVSHAALVSPGSLSDRQAQRAARCGHPPVDYRVRFERTTVPSSSEPASAPTPPKPPHASAATEPLPQGVAGR